MTNFNNLDIRPHQCNEEREQAYHTQGLRNKINVLIIFIFFRALNVLCVPLLFTYLQHSPPCKGSPALQNRISSRACIPVDSTFLVGIRHQLGEIQFFEIVRRIPIKNFDAKLTDHYWIF